MEKNIYKKVSVRLQKDYKTNVIHFSDCDFCNEIVLINK